jgi:hypothetical protein
MSRRTTFGAATLGVAMGGVLAGHALTYALVHPTPQRDHVVASTGHGYLAAANHLAVAVVVVALVAVFARRFVGRHGQSPLALRFATLAAMQTAAFVSIEVAERLVAGAPLASVVPVLVVGLPVQLVTALVASLVARIAEVAAGVAVTHGNRAGARPRSATARSTLPVPLVLRTVALAGGVGTRAPPPPR